jgi:hypothetical protein
MRHNSVALRLSIVLAIKGIYTKSGNFCHRQAYRLSIMSPIVTVSRLSFASVYSTICTKSIWLPTKIAINSHYILDFPVCDGMDMRILRYVINLVLHLVILPFLPCEKVNCFVKLNLLQLNLLYKVCTFQWQSLSHGQ